MLLELLQLIVLTRHQVFRRIMAMWIGLGMRESFAEWKTWTKKRIKQRRKDARKVPYTKMQLRPNMHMYQAVVHRSILRASKHDFIYLVIFLR